jgi:hypothetical protein
LAAYRRGDATEAWALVKELKVAVDPKYVGLAVAAHDDTQLGAATFDHVSVRNEP